MLCTGRHYGRVEDCVPDRSERWPVEAHPSVDTPEQAHRRGSEHIDARGGQRHPVPRAERLFMANVAPRFPALADCLRLLLSMEGRGHLGATLQCSAPRRGVRISIAKCGNGKLSPAILLASSSCPPGLGVLISKHTKIFLDFLCGDAGGSKSHECCKFLRGYAAPHARGDAARRRRIPAVVNARRRPTQAQVFHRFSAAARYTVVRHVALIAIRKQPICEMNSRC